MRWEEGRQKTGYFKMKLLESKWLKFDVYLLKFPKGSYIEPHYDKVKGYEHHRVNFIKNSYGGLFGINRNRGFYELSYRNIVKFRPDIEKHSVSEVKEGTRWVLSIGWLRKCIDCK